MAGGRSDERLVEDEVGLLEARFDVAEHPLVGVLAERQLPFFGGGEVFVGPLQFADSAGPAGRRRAPPRPPRPSAAPRPSPRHGLGAAGPAPAPRRQRPLLPPHPRRRAAPLGASPPRAAPRLRRASRPSPPAPRRLCRCRCRICAAGAAFNVAAGAIRRRWCSAAGAAPARRCRRAAAGRRCRRRCARPPLPRPAHRRVLLRHRPQVRVPATCYPAAARSDCRDAGWRADRP